MSSFAPTPTERALPGYQQVLYWRLTEQQRALVLLSLASIVLLVPGYLALNWLLTTLRPAAMGDLGSGWSILNLVLAFVLTIVLHEAVHGAVMAAFGAQPQFGILWHLGAAYATAPGFAFTRTQFLLVALAPLVVLDVIGILALLTLPPFGAQLAQTLVLLNTAGAVGDLAMSALVLRYPPNIMVMDEMDGIRVFAPETA